MGPGWFSGGLGLSVIGPPRDVMNVPAGTSRAYPDACTATLGYPYTDALTATTADVKTVVPAGAGVGKI